MTAVLQIVFDALSLGGLYALGALGIALIFGVMRLVNFAHGDFIAFCVFAMLWPSINAAAIVFAGNLPFYLLVPLLLLVGAGMRADKHQVAGDLDFVYREFPMLAERRQTAAGMLSGGQQQMLVIGRALMASPRLMAIDEPSLGLAPKIIDQVYDILMRLRAQRKLTLLIVEQSSTRAMMTGGRMILMRGGRIVLEGEAREMVKDERLKQAYFGFGDH